MRFEDERYVRVYTRDTATWKLLSWNARSVLQAIFRKVDRAGILELEGDPAESIAAMIDAPVEVVEEALPQLLKRGCADLRDSVLVLPRFLEAQECKQSDPARKRAQRERDRANALMTRASQDVTDRHATGQSVTKRDQESHDVTAGHTESHAVTPYRTDPVPVKKERAAGESDLAPALQATADHVARTGELPTRTALAADAPLTPELRSIAEGIAMNTGGLDIDFEWGRFAAHQRSEGKTSFDWSSAWKGWVLEAVRRARVSRSRGRSTEPREFDVRADAKPAAASPLPTEPTVPPTAEQAARLQALFDATGSAVVDASARWRGTGT